MHRHANIRHVCETYGAAGAGHPARRHDVLGRQAVLRLRHRQLAVLPVLRRREHGARAADGRRPTWWPSACSRSGRPCSSRCRRSTRRCSPATCRTTRSPRSGWPRRPGEPLPAPLLARFRGPLRRRHHRRHRLDRGAAHLPVQPARRDPARHDRACPCPATTSRSGTTTAAGARRPAGRAARARRVDRPRLLASYRSEPARSSRASGSVTGDTYVRDERRLLHLPGPQHRHAQGRRHLGLAGRGRGAADRAPDGARGGGRRGARRARHRQAGGRGRRRPGSHEAELVAWCRDGLAALQGAAPGASSSTTCRRRRPASSSGSRCATCSPTVPSRSPSRRTSPHRPPNASEGRTSMPYVIASPCIDVNDKACVEECPVDCIYEGERKSYINPGECIDCGACEPVCPVEAISQDRRVADGDEPYVADNAAFFTEVLPGRDAPLGIPGGRSKVGDLGTDTELVQEAADARRPPAGRRPRPRAGARARWRRPGSQWAQRVRTRRHPRGPLGRATGAPVPTRLDELFEEQGVDAALLFCEYSPEGHRLPAVRGPAADRRAQPGAGSGRWPTSTRTCTSRSPRR